MKRLLCLSILSISILYANNLQTKCDKGNLNSCFSLAKEYHSKQNYEKAIELYTKVCDGGDNFGCRALGAMYHKGEGVEQDVLKALEFYNKLDTTDKANTITPNTKKELKAYIKYGFDLDKINTSMITDMSGLFDKSERQDFSGIETWDVSNVENMRAMFSGAKYFNQPLNNWNVSNVKDMRVMFGGAESFNQPLDRWDVSNVKDMSLMFLGAKSFNQPLNNWNVSNVENMSFMFFDAKSFNQPLNNWNVSNVEKMNGMFSWANSFNQLLDRWDVSNVKDMSYMFSGAESFNQDLSSWDVKGKNHRYILRSSNIEDNTSKYPKNYVETLIPKTKEELKKYIDSGVELWTIDTSKITDMSGLFAESKRHDFSGIETWDVSKVENMSKMFYNARSFNQPLEGWNVRNVKDMSYMFSYAESFNQPLNRWNVSSVEDMSSMFTNAKSFSQDLSNWHVGDKKYEKMLRGSKIENDTKKHPNYTPKPKSKPSKFSSSDSVEVRCKKGDYESCVIAGYDLLGQMDRSGGYELFKKACNAKYAKGCLAMGSTWENDWSGSKDSVKNAVKFYTLAGDMGACSGYSNVGDIYSGDSELSVYVNLDHNTAKQFYQKAKNCYKQACNNGDKQSCEILKQIM